MNFKTSLIGAIERADAVRGDARRRLWPDAGPTRSGAGR